MKPIFRTLFLLTVMVIQDPYHLYICNNKKLQISKLFFYAIIKTYQMSQDLSIVTWESSHELSHADRWL